MAKQLHKKFPDQQVKSLLEKYISKEETPSGEAL